MWSSMSMAPNPPIDPHLLLRQRPPCAGRLACDLQAFTLPEFRQPLFVAFAALAVTAVVVLAWRLRPQSGKRDIGRGAVARASVPPLAGVCFVCAALVGYERSGHLVRGLAVGTVLLALGGVAADVLRLTVIPRMAVAVPGSLVLAYRAALVPLVPRWVLLFMVVYATLGAGLVADSDRRLAGSGLGPVLFAVS